MKQKGSTQRELLTVEVVAEQLRVSPDTILRMIRAGDTPAGRRVNG